MTKNTTRIAMTLSLTLALASAAFAQSTSSSMSSSSKTTKTTTTTTSASKLSATDTRFVKEAAIGGMEEVKLGQLAAQKASNPEVKHFGQRMVDDHSKANDQLKQLASQKGVKVASALPPSKKKDVDKLSRLSGASFDKAYVSMMVEDHKKDVAEFKKASASGKDADVKSWASATLPTLEDHLKMIEEIHSKMGKSGMSH